MLRDMGCLFLCVFLGMTFLFVGIGAASQMQKTDCVELCKDAGVKISAPPVCVCK